MPTNNTSTIERGKFEAAREIAFGDLTNFFQQIGSTFDASYYVVYVQNFTDVTIDFSLSYDGADVTFSLASGGTLATDMLTNGVQVSRGEAAWAKYRDGAPTSGFVQVSAVAPDM